MAIRKGLRTSKKWKPVYINPNLLSSGEFDDLAGIEELSNYEVLKPCKVRKLSCVKRKEKLQKRHKAVKNSVEKGTAIKQTKCSLITKDLKGSKRKCIENYLENDHTPKKKKQKKASSCYTKISSNISECPKQDMSAWKDLFVPEPVLGALAELGFTSPTPIQACTLPAAIRDHMDILGAAETGSGKTLAFGIPLLHHILNSKERHSKAITTENEVKQNPLRALILTPTRELAIQVKNHIQAAAKYTDIKIIVVVGGMALQKQQRLLKKQPDIVVATPGRLWELIQEGERHLSQVPSVRYLVIDEADRMVEKGHFSELTNLFELINKEGRSQNRRQTFVFSATLTMIHETPKRVLFKRKTKINQKQKLNSLMEMVGIKEKPKVIDITLKKGTVETLTEARITCSLEDKDAYLYYFRVMHPGRTLVFCNSIDCVRRLRNVLDLLGCSPLPLHASMHQRQRLKNLEKFASSSNGLLLATDVAARGLDIKNVEHIVHFQVPRTAEVYVHRSGRTARAMCEGLSVMLIEPQELHLYHRICKTLNRVEDLPIFPVELVILKIIKERVALARKIDKLEHRSKRLSAQNRWFQNAAKEAMIDLDDGLLNDLGGEKEQAAHIRQLKFMKKQLIALLQQPIMMRNKKS